MRECLSQGGLLCMDTLSCIHGVVEGGYCCYNDWLSIKRNCLASNCRMAVSIPIGFIIRNSFSLYYTYIYKIQYKLKLYYLQLMDSFNMNTFFGGISFDISRLKDLSNCKKHKIWNHFIINQSITHNIWMGNECDKVLYVLLFVLQLLITDSPSKNPWNTEHQTRAALQTRVTRCAATSKAAFTFPLRVMTCSVSITQSQNTK